MNESNALKLKKTMGVGWQVKSSERFGREYEVRKGCFLVDTLHAGLHAGMYRCQIADDINVSGFGRCCDKDPKKAVLKTIEKAQGYFTQIKKLIVGVEVIKQDLLKNL